MPIGKWSDAKLFKAWVVLSGRGAKGTFQVLEDARYVTLADVMSEADRRGLLDRDGCMTKPPDHK